jgi:predicted metal-dependent phosphoesterase TrpH
VLQLKIDLHVHSKASGDGVSSIYEIVKSAKEKQLDGVAITDHDHPLSKEDAILLSDETGFLLIPGIEVTTSSGHLIVLDPRRSFGINEPFLETVKTAVDDGSVVIIPHPTDPFSHGVGEVAVKSSLTYSLPLEVMNASTLRRYNNSASELADRLKLAKLGGSDAHWAPIVGDAFTLVESPNNTVEAVLEAVRKGRTQAYGSETHISTTIQSILRKFKKSIKL